MKTIKKTIAVMLAFIILAIFSNCSKPEPGASDTYVPDLSTPPNQWQNVADAANNFFFFSAPPPGTASGSFQANANGGSITGHLTGSFDHSSIQFTFDAGATYGGRLFTGKINGSANPVTMTLTTPAAGANPAVTISLKKV